MINLQHRWVTGSLCEGRLCRPRPTRDHFESKLPASFSARGKRNGGNLLNMV